MSPLAGHAVAAALGAVLGVGTVAITALATAALSGVRARTGRGPVLFGAALRMAGALAGVATGVALRPWSVATFVMVYLAVYLAGQGVLVFGFAPGMGAGERSGAPIGSAGRGERE